MRKVCELYQQSKLGKSSKVCKLINSSTLSKINKISKFKIVLFVVLSMLVFTACQREATPAGEDYANGNDGVDTEYVECDLEANGETGDEGSDNDESDNDESDNELVDDETKDSSEGGVIISVYAPDSNFIYFEAVDTTIKSLTYENVLKALVEQEILPKDVKILSFGNTTFDGEKMLEIEFSKEFTAFIMNQGTSGEFLTLGGIVNTFLAAFGGEKVMITVDGGPLVTSHVGEILEPMSWFGN